MRSQVALDKTTAANQTATLYTTLFNQGIITQVEYTAKMLALLNKSMLASFGALCDWVRYLCVTPN